MIQNKCEIPFTRRAHKKRGGLIERMRQDLASFENENKTMMSPQGLQGNQQDDKIDLMRKVLR